MHAYNLTSHCTPSRAFLAIFTGDIRRTRSQAQLHIVERYQEFNKLSPRGRRDDMPPADGSSTRGGSTSVRGQVRSPHMAKLQAASVPIASGSRAMGQTDRGIA